VATPIQLVCHPGDRHTEGGYRLSVDYEFAILVFVFSVNGNFRKLNTFETIKYRDIGVWRGVSKRLGDGRRPPALRAGHSRNGRMAISGVARPARHRRVGHGGLR
jgi:hypothetical protein